MPEGWAWERLKNCCSKEIKRGKSPKYTSQSGTLVFAQKCNTKYGGININLALYLDECCLSKYPKDEYMQDGDVVINSTGTGTLGRVGIYKTIDNNLRLPIVPDSHVTIIRAWNDIHPFYIYAYMKCKQKELEAKGEGSTNQKELKPLTLKELLIPIPPKYEQVRIQEQLTKALSLTEDIEDNKKDILDYIQNIKSKILDLAIRGKLVPQDPNDEPASVLLEHIRAEKEELIKKGKIKRDKKESAIFRGVDNSYYEKIGSKTYCIDEEIPYEIPDAWEWIRLENCCIKEIRRGKSPKYIDESNALVFAQKCNTKYNGIDIRLAQYLDESTLGKYPFDEYMLDGDIVINSTGTGTLGRVGIYHSEDNCLNLPIVPDSHVTVIRTHSTIKSIYIYAFMKANQCELEQKGEGSTNQKELKPLTLKEMLVPIPPYNEQLRITALLTAAFSIMYTLEKNLR